MTELYNTIKNHNMKNKIIKLIDKIQQAWNSLLYKLMFKKYK